MFISLEKDNYKAALEIAGIKSDGDTVDKDAALGYMIDAFLSIPSTLSPLINHAIAQYLSKKIMNSENEPYKLPESETELYVSRILSIVSNNASKSYILDIPYVAKLTHQYLKFFCTLTYHEAVPSINNLQASIKQDPSIVSYGFQGISMDDVVSPEIYKMMTSNMVTFARLQLFVIIGLKPHIYKTVIDSEE